MDKTKFKELAYRIFSVFESTDKDLVLHNEPMNSGGSLMIRSEKVKFPFRSVHVKDTTEFYVFYDGKVHFSLDEEELNEAARILTNFIENKMKECKESLNESQLWIEKLDKHFGPYLISKELCKPDLEDAFEWIVFFIGSIFGNVLGGGFASSLKKVLEFNL